MPYIIAKHCALTGVTVFGVVVSAPDYNAADRGFDSHLGQKICAVRSIYCV